MKKFQLPAQERKEKGRKVKKLRREGKIPANIYGKGLKSIMISVDMSEFEKVLKDAGETNIVEVLIGKDKKNTLIHNVQKDPIEDIVLHADFLAVDLKKKVATQVPIEIIGESPAEKQGKGTIITYLDEVEVEVLPTAIPDKFEIDVSKLENVDDQILVKDIKVSKDEVEILEDKEKVIVKVEELREEEEEPTPVAEEVQEAEIEGKDKEEKEATAGEETTQSKDQQQE